MTHTIQTRDGLQTFTCSADLPTIAAALAERGSAFGRDLARCFRRYGNLTPKQLNWARFMYSQLNAPRPEAAPELADVPTFDNAEHVVAMFEAARFADGRPRKLTATVGDLRVYMVERGDNIGNVNIVDRTRNHRTRFGMRPIFYCRIDSDGNVTATNNATNGIAEQIVRFISNPTAAAAEHGRVTGTCSFCRRHLTDTRSVSVGYGPVCAGHYGLPWGE